MSWRRGFFRLWLVASLVWIGFTTLNAYKSEMEPRMNAASEQTCFENRKAMPEGPNPFDCFRAKVVTFVDLVPIWPGAVMNYLMVAFGPPTAALFFWLVGSWVFAGFIAEPRR